MTEGFPLSPRNAISADSTENPVEWADGRSRRFGRSKGREGIQKSVFRPSAEKDKIVAEANQNISTHTREALTPNFTGSSSRRGLDWGGRKNRDRWVDPKKTTPQIPRSSPTNLEGSGAQRRCQRARRPQRGGSADNGRRRIAQSLGEAFH